MVRISQGIVASERVRRMSIIDLVNGHHLEQNCFNNIINRNNSAILSEQLPPGSSEYQDKSLRTGFEFDYGELFRNHENFRIS